MPIPNVMHLDRQSRAYERSVAESPDSCDTFESRHVHPKIRAARVGVRRSGRCAGEGADRRRQSQAPHQLKERGQLDKISARTYGLVLVTAAAVLWSTAGLFRPPGRSGCLDGAGVAVALRRAFARGGDPPPEPGEIRPRAVCAIGWPGLLTIPVAAISMGSFVIALKLIMVANVMAIYATVPFVAAGIAFVWIESAPSLVCCWRAPSPFLELGSWRHPRPAPRMLPATPWPSS